MKALDELYTRYPFYGHRRLRFALQDEYGLMIGRKRTLSLMETMGLSPIYPRKRLNLSQPNNHHQKYPYLLKNLLINQPNQVWGTDITYIRLKDGFVYLTAILDWFSRYVIAWQLSPILTVDFCVQALEQALAVAIPDFHNSDRGSQFTCEEYLATLEQHPEIQISMDGRGRYLDNIFTERLWRTVKYENVYLNDYETLAEARQGLTAYLDFYNQKRRHQALNYSTPAQIYFKS